MAEIQNEQADGDGPTVQADGDAGGAAAAGDSHVAEPPRTSVPSKSPTPAAPAPPPPPENVNDSSSTAESKQNDGADATIISESQPMTKTNSTTSSLGAIRDEDANGPSTYGTRSRNRPSSSRPNYADDSDGDIEHVAVRPEAAANSSRSTPSEPFSRSRATVDGTNSGSGGFKASNLSYDNHLASNLARSDKASSTPEGDAPPEKKKRKYERTSAGRSSLNNSLQGNDSHPGNSANATPEPPPTKRRKANAGDGLSAGSSSFPQSSQRKQSLGTSKPTGRGANVVTFEKTGYVLKNGKMEADDGAVYSVNDYVYLICEPPGDPYYLCRIMQFIQNDSNDPKSPVTRILVNWFYRPKDIGRYSSDPRYLFASMQSDESPITSLRGKCTIKHRTEIKDVDTFRKERDTFWFNQLYDRYIHRPYEVIPSSTVINVPENVKKALDERWKFLIVEPARMKELTSAVKLCKRCNAYCAPNDSVDCGVCRNTYHMTCVRPPLLKKPSRGFAWSCGPCSRAQEKRLEQRHANVIKETGADRDDDVVEDEEEDPGTIKEAHEPQPESNAEQLPVAQAEVAQAKMWPWRYLGIHCRVEDVLQYDDRAIYPRASSRLGPKHQAHVVHWYGRPVQLVKAPEIKKKWIKGTGIKKDAKLSKETLAALEEAKASRATRPKWVQDEPPGYIARGEDYDNDDEQNTAQRLFVPPATSKPAFAAANATGQSNDQAIDDYMEKAKALAKERGFTRKVYTGFRREFQTPLQDLPDVVPTNFLDKALQVLSKHRMNGEAALKELREVSSPKDFGDPEFTKEEVKKFEDGVHKHASELRSVRRVVKSRPHSEIVRFYYNWKKTERGQQVWGQHEQRRSKNRKLSEQSWQDIADDEDDSAFDNEKANSRKRGFSCKFCSTRTSRQWRRAPNVAPGATTPADPKLSAKDKGNQLVVAMCQRCAFPWRKYAIRWEDPEELAKAIVAVGGRAWKRRNDEDLLRELVLANEMARIPTGPVATDLAKTIGVHVTVSQEKSKKLLKGKDDKETTPVPSTKPTAPAPPPPRQPTPPVIPQQPTMRDLPCEVCRDQQFPGDELVVCKECKLTVHRRCYAVPDSSNSSKWICDTCLNDKNNINALDYFCVLCPRRERIVDLIELPKLNHRKKTDRDKEREKLEKDLAQDMLNNYRKRQEEQGRPTNPREALKRTTNNNWMHVVCAIWTPDVRFSHAEKLERAEGMGSAVATTPRLDQLCKFCKEPTGVVIGCYQCHQPFHVSCAQEDGSYFGFDVIPIKGSRKDANQTVTLTSDKGTEVGTLTPAVWCKEHTTKTIFHPMTEIVPDTGLNLLQTYARTFKQADLTFTGTARKANLLSNSTKAAAQVNAPPSGVRRASTATNGAVALSRSGRASPPPRDESGGQSLANGVSEQTSDADRRNCITCKTGFALRWWPVDAYGRDVNVIPKVNGMVNGDSTYHTHEDSTTLWQCHKCHTRAKLGLSAEPVDLPARDEEPLPSLENVPDYFTATAPTQRQPPVQPPAATPNPPQLVNPLPPYQPVGVWPRERYDVDADYHTQALWNSTIVLHNLRSGAQQRISGREFGSLDGHGPATFDRFCRLAETVGYHPDRNIIMTEDRVAIKDPGRLGQALVGLMQGQRREVHWRVVEETDPYGYQILHRSQTPMVPQHSPVYGAQPPLAAGPPGPPGHAPYPHHGPPPPPPPQAGSPYAMHGHPPPPHQQAPPNYPPPPPPHRADMPMGAPNGGSPYYNHPQPVPMNYPHGNTSPPKPAPPGFGQRPTTPRDQRNGPPAAGGASSSPSLKNLMH